MGSIASRPHCSVMSDLTSSKDLVDALAAGPSRSQWSQTRWENHGFLDGERLVPPNA